MNARRWIVLVIVLVFGVALLGCLLWWRIDSAWRGMLAIGARIEKETDARKGVRPVLYGESTTGNAFTDYEAAWGHTAVDALSDWENNSELEFEDLLRQPATVDAEVWQLLQKAEPAFAAVRTGAHRSVGRQQILWGAGVSGAGPDVLKGLDFHSCLVLHAWQLAQADRDAEAVKVLLDALQFDRDYLDDPVMIVSIVGAAQLRVVAGQFFVGFDEDKSVEQPPALPIESLNQESLTLLQNGLAKLDRPLTKLARSVQIEAALLVREIQARGTTLGGPLANVQLGGWRFAFSARWMLAQAVADMDLLAQDMPLETAPWSEWQAFLQGRNLVGMRNRNPVLAVVVPNYESMAAGRREGLLAIRALRSIVADALGKPFRPMDPFAPAPLKRGKVRGRDVLWSVGKDGVDHGGDRKADRIFVR